jgi:uncharacterized DUF497 family protein
MMATELEFEWDEAKARSNPQETRGLVPDCRRDFFKERLERIDDREDYGEIRWIALARVAVEVNRIVFTWRSDILVRIVGAQKTSNDEQEIYYRETLSW